VVGRRHNGRRINGFPVGMRRCRLGRAVRHGAKIGVPTGKISVRRTIKDRFPPKGDMRAYSDFSDFYL